MALQDDAPRQDPRAKSASVMPTSQREPVSENLQPGERAYSGPALAPAESDYRTLDNARVRLDPSIDPLRQPTQVALRTLQQSIPPPMTGVVVVGILALLGGGALSWLFMDAMTSDPSDPMASSPNAAAARQAPQESAQVSSRDERTAGGTGARGAAAGQVNGSHAAAKSTDSAMGTPLSSRTSNLPGAVHGVGTINPVSTVNTLTAAPVLSAVASPKASEPARHGARSRSAVAHRSSAAHRSAAAHRGAAAHRSATPPGGADARNSQAGETAARRDKNSGRASGHQQKAETSGETAPTTTSLRRSWVAPKKREVWVE